MRKIHKFVTLPVVGLTALICGIGFAADGGDDEKPTTTASTPEKKGGKRDRTVELDPRLLAQCQRGFRADQVDKNGKWKLDIDGDGWTDDASGLVLYGDATQVDKHNTPKTTADDTLTGRIVRVGTEQTVGTYTCHLSAWDGEAILDYKWKASSK